DFFFAIARVKKLIGQNVIITGWYRRGPGPYLQVSRIETETGKRYRNFINNIYRFFAFLIIIIGFLIVFFVFLTPIII
ncbi:MAG: hypothetical protein ACFFAN_18735, partial [Promethearchaeota archaeon]